MAKEANSSKEKKAGNEGSSQNVRWNGKHRFNEKKCKEIVNMIAKSKTNILYTQKTK